MTASPLVAACHRDILWASCVPTPLCARLLAHSPPTGTKMKNMQLTTISMAIGLIFSAGVMAQAMTKDAYKAAEAQIATEYTADKAKCNALAANAKDICIAEAKGKAKVASAELEANYEPSAKHHYKAVVAKAEADYAVADEKCDDQAGNAKDLCVKEAKAVETRVRADAEAQLKMTEANKTASDKSTAADTKAKEAGVSARQDAAAEKGDANYAVAKEKCAALMAPDSDRCLKDAKAKYGK
ncbi:hypothetical protein [uncultured Thiodictyon sp.]|uniref:hypothetical protein n=1 Tax=uncultured Thiodictyon sp. TaxID=1846217 RepID=UPI0025CFEF21|nr:hypothetical protein [uncultured Thiodictyon sp.]